MSLKPYLSWKTLVQNKSLNSIAMLMSSTVLSQILPILFFPILSRLYSPADYGVLGLFMSISLLIVVFSCLQLNLAILTPKDAKEALNLFLVGLYFCVILSSAMLIVIFFFKKKLSFLLNSPELEDWLFIIPPLVFVSGSNIQLTAWFNRLGDFKIISISRIVISIVTVALNLLLFFFIKGPGALIISYTIGALISFFLLARKFFKIQKLSFITIADAIMVLKKYRNFPLYTLPTELISTLSQQLPMYIFSIYSGAESVGLFSRSRQLLGLPSAYISGAVSEVYRQKASIHFQNDRVALRKLFIRTTLYLIGISIVPFFILGLFSPEIYAILFGEKWREAGVYSQCLVLMYFVKFIVTPPSYVFYFFNKQRLDLLIQILIMASTGCSLAIGLGYLKSEILALILFSTSYAFLFSIYGFYSYRLVTKKYDKNRLL